MDNHLINQIRQQHTAGQWPQFLEMVGIDGLRGWTGQSVAFRFPVCAVVGENGVGKSTLLKVAATAYDPSNKDAYFPSDFFLSTHWDDFAGVTLTYRVKRGDDIQTFSIKKPTKRWSYPETRIQRKVYWLDIARTLPLDATAGYARVARLAAGENETQPIQQEFLAHLSHILGREYRSARFAAPDVNAQRLVGLVERDFGEISQFHQGAGEDTTLDLTRTLQSVQQYSLLLIDEVEASLHPRAQRRLVRVLLNLARLKRIQVILSTHSPFVLEELPPEARILLIPSTGGPEIVYGASSQFALSRIDDDSHPELALYVEDPEAAVWLREIVAQSPEGPNLLPRIQISPVGATNVVQVMGQLTANDRLPSPGWAFPDADADPSPGCELLPGDGPPERVVFRGLQAAGWPNLAERFGVGAGTLFAHFETAMTLPDHHDWCAHVGDNLLKSKGSVWEIMATEWCRSCLSEQERNRIVARIQDRLDV